MAFLHFTQAQGNDAAPAPEMTKRDHPIVYLSVGKFKAHAFGVMSTTSWCSQAN